MDIQDNEAGKGEYNIYNALVDGWLRRELTKKPDLPIKDLHDTCLVLAVWMQVRQKREISEKDVDKLIERIFKIKAIKKIELKGRSLLNRNSEGDYRFSHYSIQEFCVAKYISKMPAIKLSFRQNDRINLTDQIVKMIAESGEIDPDLDIGRIDLSQINPAEKNRKKITKYGMDFVYIPPGAFKMGSPKEEKDRKQNETLHTVFLTKGFYMQTTPVTQAQWEAVMESNPSRFKGGW
jgi:hypothetical protein